MICPLKLQSGTSLTPLHTQAVESEACLLHHGNSNSILAITGAQFVFVQLIHVIGPYLSCYFSYIPINQPRKIHINTT